jgi:hypothetical protein
VGKRGWAIESLWLGKQLAGKRGWMRNQLGERGMARLERAAGLEKERELCERAQCG